MVQGIKAIRAIGRFVDHDQVAEAVLSTTALITLCRNIGKSNISGSALTTKIQTFKPISRALRTQMANLGKNVIKIYAQYVRKKNHQHKESLKKISGN